MKPCYKSIFLLLSLFLLNGCKMKSSEVFVNSKSEETTKIEEPKPVEKSTKIELSEQEISKVFTSPFDNTKIKIIDSHDASLGVILYSNGMETNIDAKMEYGVLYINWSPNNEYALIDFGSYAIRFLSVIDIKNKIHLGNIALVWPKKIFWINENTVLIEVTASDYYMDGPNIRSTIVKYRFDDNDDELHKEIYYESDVYGELQSSYHLEIDDRGCSIIKKSYRAIEKDKTGLYDQFNKEDEIVIERIET